MRRKTKKTGDGSFQLRPSSSPTLGLDQKQRANSLNLESLIPLIFTENVIAASYVNERK